MYTNTHYQQPIVAHYQSPSDYIFDTLGVKTNEVYSATRKAYNPVVPYNTQSFHYMPVMGHFDYTRLQQMGVLDLIYSLNNRPAHYGEVSLAQTISPLINKMGAITDSTNGESVGTCALIAHNLVLVARHSVAGRDLTKLQVTFGYTEFLGTCYSAGYTSFECVIEEDARCDYAIIQLTDPVGEDLGFVCLDVESQAITEPALLHYPLGKPLKVSVHTFMQTQYQSDYLVAFHDSDYQSSGGAYFDPEKRMIALHLGSQIEEETMNLVRYAIPLKRIVEQNPNSLFKKLAHGELSQGQSYCTKDCVTYLEPSSTNLFIDEEGYESEKILRGLLEKELKKDKKIKLNKNKTISFSKANLAYIEQTYPRKFEKFTEQCVGMTGLHNETKKYSVKGVIESDHTIPHNVWKKTTNPKMRALVKGKGTRPGENQMPAITLPNDIHRNLRTTGGVTGHKEFHADLTKLCNAGKIDDALIQCYKEYDSNGLDMDDYRNNIESSLADYVDLGLITNAQKKRVIRKTF